MDECGRFVLQGIAAGDYKLLAWEDVEADASQDSEFLSALEGKGAPFTVGELSRQSANVKLIPAVGLRGIGSTPPSHNCRLPFFDRTERPKAARIGQHCH